MAQRRLALLAFVLCCLVVLPAAMAGRGRQMPAVASAVGLQDLSGFWELSYDSRSVPAASLLPTITRSRLDAKAKADAYAVRWCNLLGMPFVMDSGRPLDIRVGTTAVIVAPESHIAPRYLYLNRTTHVSDDIFDPSTNGDSIARWEGDALVVDTVGFHPERGITAIPGGGYRTATSHLVEQFRLLKNGAILAVTSTWTDPKVFRTPHRYEFRYYRLPANYEPRPWLPCDPFDPVRTSFLAGPAAAKPTPAGR